MTIAEIILATLSEHGALDILTLERRLSSKGVRYNQVPGNLQELIHAGKVDVALGLYRAAS